MFPGGERMKHYLAAVVAIFSLIGCAAQLTQQGRMVREIQPDWGTKCEFLGVIDASEGKGWDIADDRRGALNRIRNQVAELGGNAFVISQSTSSASRTLIQADAYKCP
jgi:hypothetical protein